MRRPFISRRHSWTCAQASGLVHRLPPLRAPKLAIVAPREPGGDVGRYEGRKPPFDRVLDCSVPRVADIRIPTDDPGGDESRVLNQGAGGTESRTPRQLAFNPEGDSRVESHIWQMVRSSYSLRSCFLELQESPCRLGFSQTSACLPHQRSHRRRVR